MSVLIAPPRIFGLVRIGVVFALALLVLPAPASGQSRVRTEVDTTLVTVGDRIVLTVQVEHATDASVSWPDSLDLSSTRICDARIMTSHHTRTSPGFGEELEKLAI